MQLFIKRFSMGQTLGATVINKNRYGLILLAHFTVQTNCPLRLKDVSSPPLEIKDRAKNPN